MEKISKIIPPNRRTQPFDVPPGQGKAPGVFQARKSAMDAPLGLDEGLKSVDLDGPGGIVDKITISSPGKEVPGYEKMKEAQNVQAVERISQRFFGGQAKSLGSSVNSPLELAKDSDVSKSEEVTSNMQRNEELSA